MPSCCPSISCAYNKDLGSVIFLNLFANYFLYVHVVVWTTQIWGFDLGWDYSSPFKDGAQFGNLPGLTLAQEAGDNCG